MIKAAIIPIAGLGTRFLPLSKVLPKELFPLVDIPALQYIIEEAVVSGIKQITFVTRPEKKLILDYFLKDNRLIKKALKERKKNEILKELSNFERILKNISISWVVQKEPLGDGHAVLQAKEKVKKEKGTAVLFGDDIVESKKSCLAQMIEVFKKYKKPVVALCKIPKESLSSYGIVKVKKMKNRVYKIEEIIEKPKISEAPSNLAIVGKYIITPEIFSFLEKPSLTKGEIRLAGAFNQMIKDDKRVLGYEFKGKWLECGDKLAYLKSNLYLMLKHPQFGPELRKFLRTWRNW